MRTATRLVVCAAAFLALSASANAQPYDVTFQVDLNEAITTCNFDPATDQAYVRGSLNDWGNGGDGPLEDYELNDNGEDGDATAGDGIYSGTFAVEEAEDVDTETAGIQVNYKFFGSTPQTDYEGGENRSATIT